MRAVAAGDGGMRHGRQRPILLGGDRTMGCRPQEAARITMAGVRSGQEEPA